MQVNDVGALTYFRGSNVWVLPGDFDAALIANGFDPGTLAIPDLSVATVSRAVRAADNWRTKDLRADVVAVNGTAGQKVTAETVTVDFGILHRVQVSDTEVRWEQFDSVRYDRANGWIGGQTDKARELIALGEKWQSHLDYGVVRRVTFSLIEALGAFSVGGSGVQYVHGPQMARFSAIRSMVASIPGATLHAIRVDPADPDSVSAIGGAAQESMSAKVDNVLARLAEWQDRARGRTSTLERMLLELQDVRDEAAGLCSALRFSTDAIDAAISAASAQVSEAIAGHVAPETFAPPVIDPAPVVETVDPVSGDVTIPDAVILAPERVAGPIAPTVIEESDPFADPVVPKITIPADLDTIPSFDLRKLANAAGVPGWATKPRSEIVASLNAIR